MSNVSKARVQVDFGICHYCRGEGTVVESYPNRDIDVKCPLCEGTGTNRQWVSIEQLAKMLEEAGQS